MSAKERTDFVCPECGSFLERQHWGISQDLTVYKDMLTCSDLKCSFNKIVKCIHKDLNQEKQEKEKEG